ncbi:MAG: hypothetical protein C4340_03120 [Armatimonadota bacterium]
MVVREVRHEQRAFTLIELLVVIAIVAIMAAILFPVFIRSKEAAKRIACLSNMKQLGMAVMMYGDSHDGFLPMATNFAEPPESPLRLWTGQVHPYIGNQQLVSCPSQPGKYGETWAERAEMTIGYSGATAYDPNGCDENDPDPIGCEGFTRPASVRSMDRPADIGLFADTPGGPVSAKYRGYTFSPYSGADDPLDPRMGAPLCSDRDLVLELNNLPPSRLKPIFARHQKRGDDRGFTNVMFADGHAKGYSAKSINAKSAGAAILWRFR